MGLDMFLNRKVFVNYYDLAEKMKSGEIEKPNFNVYNMFLKEYFDKKYPFNEIKPERVSYIAEEIAYWRKANAIHRWFVENVQNGVDDWGEYPVKYEQLMELHDLCIRVKENKALAPDLLPTQTGFFFGSTEYDEYYWQNIDDTIEMLTGLDEVSYYYYRASW